MYNISLKWLTVTCFEIKFGNTTVVTDPFIGESPNNDLTYKEIDACDIITLSHVHWDHITDIPLLMDKYPNSKLLCGTLSAMPMLEWINCNPSRVLPMDCNLELDFDEIKVKALFGMHTTQPGHTYSSLKERFEKNALCIADKKLNDMQLLGSLEYRNYLFTYNGVKVLIWGNDTDVVQKNMVAQQKPDICIMQCTKQPPAQLAEIAKNSGCKVLIPHHMDLSKTKEQYMDRMISLQQEYLKRVPDGKFILPNNNEWINL